MSMVTIHTEDLYGPTVAEIIELCDKRGGKYADAYIEVDSYYDSAHAVLTIQRPQTPEEIEATLAARDAERAVQAEIKRQQEIRVYIALRAKYGDSIDAQPAPA